MITYAVSSELQNYMMHILCR